MKTFAGLTGFALALAVAAPAMAAGPAKDPSLSAYAKPHRLVALPDGRRINLDCVGHGSPTVVLNAGLNGFSSSWRTVQGAIARRARVCAWDPPGLGWSDPSPEPQDAAHAAADVYAALKAAGIDGPYVVVGHSAGGYVSLAFTDRHRAEVVGMVLVDPSIPDQFAVETGIDPQLANIDRAFNAHAVAKLRDCAAKLKAGPQPQDDCVTYFPEYPDDLVAAIRRLDADPARLMTKASIEEQFEASGRQAVDPKRNYGDLPLIVLTAGKPMPMPPELASKQDAGDKAWRRGHDRLAALSRRGSNRIVPGSGHTIQREKPKAVIAAVDEVLDRARAP